MPKRRNSPTQHSLSYFKAKGIPCAVTEKWIAARWRGAQGGGFRQDVFGGDLIALVNDGVLNIQAGSDSSHAEKVKKAVGLPEVKQWLSGTARFFWVMTWGQRVHLNKDGRRVKVKRWTPRVTQLRLVDGQVTAEPFTLI